MKQIFKSRQKTMFFTLLLLSVGGFFVYDIEIESLVEITSKFYVTGKKFCETIFFVQLFVFLDNTALNLRVLMDQLQSDKNLSKTASNIILQQSLMNFMETENASHILPIPLSEKKILAIFSSWRSGSTFVGDVLQSLPGTYYHYEPFDYQRHKQQSNTTDMHIQHVKALLQCNFGTNTTLQHLKMYHHWNMNRNLRKFCGNSQNEDICNNTYFRSVFCNLFPRQNMKFVRSRITLAEYLLEDPQLHTDVILLGRDPRGVFHSRKTFDTCPQYPECFNMAVYCKYLVDDYHNIMPILEKYRKHVRVVRFEDLALNPISYTKELLDHFGIPFDDQVKTFLDLHTTKSHGGLYGTFRDSKAVVTKWMHELTFNEVTNVQKKCQEAMRLWGYTPLTNKAQLKSKKFNPVGNFTVF